MNRTIRLLICLLCLSIIGCSSSETDPADGASGPVETIAPQEEEYDPNGMDAEGWTPIMWAVRDGAALEIAALLDSGADPNAVDEGNNGWTVLMHAIHTGNDSAARLLLDRGADVNRRSRNGRTALMMAAGYGNAPLVEALLRGGADAYAEAPDGLSVLSMAVGGIADIEHFTFGECQTATVRALKEAAPDLQLNDSDRLARLSAWWGGCDEIMAMVR